ncbi:receptor-like protein 7 [Solanum stenotomum]|uniref:receptor-like protein 7 n=1 Tax=Solanum stenotomum TaxID=172797 RepID=UPI0020D0B44B|nr:receptor-like protein 7 [Solanum stenotomum]
MPEAVLAGVQTLTVVVDSLCLDCFHVFPEFHQFQAQVPVHPSSFQTKQSQLTYAGQHLCARDDAFYLLQFKKGLTVVDQNIHDCDNETRAKTLSWNVTGDCCQWDGVTCNGFTGHVIGLDLSCSILNQTINANSSLTKLGHLQRLNLAFSQFDDDFPLGLSELSSLTHLNLSNTGFNEGEIQIPPGLSKLVSLDLSSNDFQVGRTTSRSLLQNLTNLEVLLLDSVDAPFELPKNFPSSLRYLILQDTNMCGNISDSQFFHLPNLQVLRMGWNPLLTGTLPNFNWSFSTSILELDFFYTDIFGKVPDSIGNLHSLWYLDLSLNRLSGLIPVSVGNLSGIRVLTLSSNSFTGNVPSTISKLNKLVDLDLSFNDFQGSILESIGNLTAITKLTLSGNNFTGNVPSTIKKLKTLNYLTLSFNNFESSIPDNFANFSEPSFLYLQTNNFTGPLPYLIATLTRLQELNLQNNLLTGPLPSNLSRLQELETLDFSFNYFNGTIPPWLFRLPSLVSLSIQYNELTGKLPNELKSITLATLELIFGTTSCMEKSLIGYYL